MQRRTKLLMESGVEDFKIITSGRKKQICPKYDVNNAAEYSL